MNCLVIGASSGLGKALAEELAQRGNNLFLVSSDKKDLGAIAADLKIKYGVQVDFADIDLANFEIDVLLKSAAKAFKNIDSLFFVAGVFDDNERAPIADDVISNLVQINYLAGIRIVNAFLPQLNNNANGNIIGIGSIAATRARTQNMVYGSTKAALEFYFLGLRHYLGENSCKVQFYRLGYMKSQMTFGKKLLFPPVSPQYCAKIIADNLGRDLGLKYLPSWWSVIMLVYRLLPWPLFRRLRVN